MSLTYRKRELNRIHQQQYRDRHGDAQRQKHKEYMQRFRASKRSRELNETPTLES